MGSLFLNSEEDYGSMNKSLIYRLRKPYRWERLWERILSYFFFKQWVLMIAKGMNDRTSLWEKLIQIVPPPDRLWADPFVWVHEGRYFIFHEERFYASDRGHIACLTLDSQLKPVDNCVVLQRPYHLSYPFLFEYQDQLYMLPETEKNRTVELYRCTRFPDQWEFVKTLLSDIKAIDATLLQAYGKWWLFANIREGGTTWDALHLFFADDLLSQHWEPHPRNPVVKDIRSARPAGRIFLENGNFIRPSQDCSIRYGYATNFNRIVILTETDYLETREWTLKPPEQTNILGTHTWNQAGGLTAIDAFIRRTKHKA